MSNHLTVVGWPPLCLWSDSDHEKTVHYQQQRGTDIWCASWGVGGGCRIKERTPPGPRVHGRLRGARQRPLEDAFLTGGRMSSGEKGQKADLHWILPGDDITWPYEIK